jgi:sialate O-acetylesterase
MDLMKSTCPSLHPLRSLFSATFLLCATTPLFAEIRLPHFFSDHMVLQREREVAVWGEADPGASVELSFKEKKALATADEKGFWKAAIQSGAADATGAVFTISAGKDKIELRDVLVGEVWFASGQSNMVFRIKSAQGGQEFAKKADFPAFRFFDGPNVTASEPQKDIEGHWATCTPQTVMEWSAVATFFAARLHQELGVPIGIIESSWGGKPIETFISREALNTLAATKTLVDSLYENEKTYDPASAQAAYEKSLETWKNAVSATKSKEDQNSIKKLRKPDAPKRPLLSERNPGVLFDAMIHPFIGYTIRGAIWYQGEGNSHPGSVPYDQTLPLLIQDWRKRWNDSFSFYYVQLANYHQPTTQPGIAHGWPLVQDGMRRVLAKVPKTGMAVINDVGEATDIHPKDKRTPAERLALWALANDYGRQILFSSPLFKDSSIQGNEIVVTFEHAGAGLKAKDGGPLKRFEIAGQDRKWFWAKADITSKDTIRVSSPEVPKPFAVRYAWAANPEGANLVNSGDLPASVFRTDDWDDVIPPPTANTMRASKVKQMRELAQKLKETNPKSEEAKAMKSKLDQMLKAFKDSAPTSK